MIDSDASWKLFDTIKSIASSNSQSTNAMATCVRVLSDGTRMMQLVGSSILTPLNGNMAAEISQGDMAEVRIEDGVMSLTANVSNPSVGQSEVDDAVSDRATVRQLGESNARIENLEVTALTAESATIANLQADTAKVHDLTADQLTAATAYVGALDAGNVTAAQLIADHGTIGTLDTTYMHADMANADVAWIQNGTIKDGAIVSAMINDVSANKLTAGTINGSVINVTNLNADNITAGTINGQRIGQGSLSLDKLSEDVYTESEVDSKLATMQAEIDGAIETWTGTVVPTLNNSPASGWTTNAVRDTHVGDVYFVVNSQSQQNGYNYRFTKSGSTYSWQLIKDNDVTNALQRLETAEGKITSIESFDSTVSSFMTDTDSELTSVKSRATSLETRMTDAEEDISEKVDTSTFNTLSQTVDGNSASITSMGTVLTNNGLTSSTNITNTVNTVSQTASGNSSKITQLTTTLGTNADGTTKAGDVVHRTSAVEQDLSGFKTTVSQTYATNTTVDGLATRVSTAETNISQNAQNIELKVSKDGVISSINQSAESVKIQASKVEIDGAAVFSAISDDVDSAITSKGYATTAQAQGYATTAKSEAISSAATDATTKANTAEANAKAYTDSLEVGGRNLLYDTSDWSKWAKTAKATATDNVLTCTNTDTSSGFQRANGWFIPDKADVMDREIVISFDVKKTDSTELSSLVFQMFTTSAAPRSVASGNINEGTRYYSNLSAKSTSNVTILNASEINATAWTRVSIGFVPSQVFNTSYTEQAYLAVYVGISNKVASAQFRHIKAEYGNKATDWSPAPEDLVTSTQRIYYRWNSATAPAAPTSWVTKGDDGSALWTKMHVSITSTHKYIYTCEQYEMADGTLGHTDVLLDNTITVIDGGNIITGSVTANKLNASDINASKTLTVGAMTDAAAATILNSNISVGGRNLALDSRYFSHNATANDTYVGVWSLPVAQRVFVSRNDGFVALALKQSQNWAGPAVYMDSLGLAVGDLVAFSCLYEYQGCNGDLHFYAMSVNSSRTRTYPTFELKASNGFGGTYHSVTQLATISSTNKSGKVWVVAKWSQAAQDTIDAGGHVCFTFQMNGITEVTSGGSVHLYATKLERGNKATDWSPAPEDVDAAVSDAAKTATSYITQVDQSGITIHPSGGTSNRVEIDADGMEVYKGNVSVASYGDTARIGKEDAAHINISSDSVVIDSGGTTSPVIMTTSNGYSHIQADYIDALQYLSSFDGLSSNWLNIGGTNTIYGVRFGFSSATTNSNGITTFNPNLGKTPTAVFVAAGKASNETEAVAKIAVPMVWSIDSATQVQVRWKRSDTNAWLTNNAVGWYWLALA